MRKSYTAACARQESFLGCVLKKEMPQFLDLTNLLQQAKRKHFLLKIYFFEWMTRSRRTSNQQQPLLLSVAMQLSAVQCLGFANKKGASDFGKIHFITVMHFRVEPSLSLTLSILVEKGIFRILLPTPFSLPTLPRHL